MKLERHIADNRTAMEAELNALQQEKMLAKNNLAGATWEQSIPPEMHAVSEKYKIDISIAQGGISHLRRDLSDLRAR